MKSSAFIALFILCLTPCLHADADPFDRLFKTLATRAYEFGKGPHCDDFDAAQTEKAMSAIQPTCPYRSPGQTQFIKSYVEDDFFKTLALEGVPELKCAGDYCSAAAHDADTLHDFATKAMAIKDLTRQQMSIRQVCPSTLEQIDQASRSTLSIEARERCRQKVKIKLAIEAIRASVPMNTAPTLKKIFDDAQDLYNRPGAEYQFDDEKKIQNRFAFALDTTATELKKESKTLKNIADTQGGRGLSRSVRIALYADPLLVKRVVERSGNDKGVRAVACHADAGYGAGEHNLEFTLGTLGLLSMFVAPEFKMAGAAGGASKGANVLRESGAVTLSGAHVFGLVGTFGVNTLAAFSNAERACLTAGKFIPIQANACISAPTVAQMNTDNCALSFGLATLGVASPFIARLSAVGKRKLASAAATEGRTMNTSAREPLATYAVEVSSASGVSPNAVIAEQTSANQVITAPRFFKKLTPADDFTTSARRYVRDDFGLEQVNPKYLSNISQADKASTQYLNSFKPSDSVESFLDHHLREQHEIITGQKSGNTYEFNGYSSADPKVVGPGKFRDEVYDPKTPFRSDLRMITPAIMDLKKTGVLAKESPQVLGLDDALARALKERKIPTVVGGKPTNPKNSFMHEYPATASLPAWKPLIYERYKDAWAAVNKPGKKPEDIVAAVNKIADYYHTAINSHLFGRVNASLFMNDVNVFLRKTGVHEIPHGDLDFFATAYDYKDFRKIFLTYVRDKQP